MDHHPIESLMKTAMENLKEMVDVNKIVGDAVETPDGGVIIPVARVSFGFAAGGTEFEQQSGGAAATAARRIPLAGAAAAVFWFSPLLFSLPGRGRCAFYRLTATLSLTGSSIWRRRWWRRSGNLLTGAAAKALRRWRSRSGAATARAGLQLERININPTSREYL